MQHLLELVSKPGASALRLINQPERTSVRLFGWCFETGARAFSSGIPYLLKVGHERIRREHLMTRPHY